MAQTRKANLSREAFAPGDAITCTAGAAITGKRFVKVVSGGYGNKPKVQLCGAGERPFGIAEYDAASGADVSVLRQGCFEVNFTAAAVTGGAEVESAANGQAKVFASGIKGGVLAADVASGGDGFVVLNV